MLAFLSAVALAAPRLELPELRHPGPYEVTEDLVGKMTVLDSEGEVVPVYDVLLLAHAPEVAERYRKSRGTRKAGAVLMWVGGSGSLMAGLISFASGSDLTAGAGAALLGTGLVAGGYGLLYGHAAQRLDYWVDADELRAGLADGDGERRVEVPRGRGWTIDTNGVARGTHDERLRVASIAAALGDTETLAAYRRWQREQYVTWGVVATAGSVFTVVGLQQGDSLYRPRRIAAAYGMAGVGGVTLVAGVVGLALADRPRHSDVWFTEAEREDAVTIHNQGALLVRERPTLVTIRPVVSPSWVGVSGTF